MILLGLHPLFHRAMIDWKQAFPRQDPKLGIEPFLRCGFRPSLIPILIRYLEDRTQIVKWHGETSSARKVPGGGSQGAYFGNLEYLAQSNDNANYVPENSRYKFVDDLTVLEKNSFASCRHDILQCKKSNPK